MGRFLQVLNRTWNVLTSNDVHEASGTTNDSRKRRRHLFEHLESRDLLAAASLTIENGAEHTNIRDVMVTFENEGAGAEEVRFAFNSTNYGDWVPFETTEQVQIPSFVGTNWVNAQIRNGSGDVTTVFDSINYTKAVLTVNEGEDDTNTKLVDVDFSSIYGSPEQVRFKMNESAWSDWQAYSATVQVQIPSYVGRNWVKAEIQYENGGVANVYDSIKYSPAVLQVNDGEDDTNIRLVDAGFSNIHGTPEQVRFRMNASDWGDWQVFKANLNVQIPSYVGRNWVKAQIKYDNGGLANVYDSIKYTKVVLTVNGGDDDTNTRLVSAGFTSIFGNPEQVRFRMNASDWGDWQNYNESVNVQIPAYVGRNWVKAQIKYDNGALTNVYDSIKLTRAVLSVNGGDAKTNARLSDVEFTSVFGSPQQVRFRMNAGNWGAWQDYSDSTKVQIPSYVGKNWVKAQIKFKNGGLANAYDSIEYTKAQLVVNANDEVTNRRMVNVDFSNIFGSPEQVRFAFNSSQWSDWRVYDDTVKVQIPNYEGRNWIKAQIKYSTNGVAGAYDSIDFVRPIIVTAGKENIRFSLNIQDSANEGFRDNNLGTKRIAAAKYALKIWSSKLTKSYDGETVGVKAKMDPLKVTKERVTLGGASPNDWTRRVKNNRYTWYGDALSNHLAKRDVDPNTDEVFMVFNSEIDKPDPFYGDNGWYYGTDGNPGQDRDFVTVVLHEIGHGLNFTTEVTESGQWFDRYLGIYDHFIKDHTGKSFASMTIAERAAAIAGGQLFWTGSKALAANNGNPIQLHTPTQYSSGSSVSHLSESIFGNEIMSPRYSGPDHQFSPLELGIFGDMGWTTS